MFKKTWKVYMGWWKERSLFICLKKYRITKKWGWVTYSKLAILLQK